MSIRSRSTLRRLAPAALLALGSCTGDAGSGAIHRPLIMDQLHNGGTTGFLFLPPMVPRPADLGDIVTDLPVTVRIDELDGQGGTRRTVATFAPGGGKDQEIRYHVAGASPGPLDDGDLDPLGYYLARWKTSSFDLSLEAIYRVHVEVPARGGGRRELGFADVDVVRNQRQFRSIDREEFTPLIDGDTLRIKFRVDRPAVDGDADGVLDWVDNCPTVANADQVDSVGNGIGDVCRCEALPADFGGITCKASVATVDGAKKELTHDFGGGAVGSAHLELSCAPTAARVGAPPTNIQSGVLYVACSGATFVLDPAVGPGVRKVSSVGELVSQTLRFDQGVARKAESCPGGTCTRTTLSFDVALGDLRAAGLASCSLGWSATATPGAAKVENGRLLDRGSIYPSIRIGAIELWNGQDKTAAILETLDGKTLAGDPSRVRTVCGRTADHGASTAPALPTMCQVYADDAGSVARLPFADLHTTIETARLTDRAAFGQLGQLVGGWCPGVGDTRNIDEVYRVALKPGQAQPTLTLKLQGTVAQLASIGPAVSLKIAAQAPGGAPVALRTLNVDEWPDTGNLVVNVPPDIAAANGTLLLQAFFDRKKKDPPPPPPPEPGPSDHIDLALDVDVK